MIYLSNFFLLSFIDLIHYRSGSQLGIVLPYNLKCLVVFMLAVDWGRDRGWLITAVCWLGTRDAKHVDRTVL